MTAPHRRLLDLLAGWMAYVDNCSAHAHSQPGGPSEAEYDREVDVLHELYQSVGARESMTAEEVDAWCRTNITAFLRIGAAQVSSPAKGDK